jgi:hypothetical protein
MLESTTVISREQHLLAGGKTKGSRGKLCSRHVEGFSGYRE